MPSFRLRASALAAGCVLAFGTTAAHAAVRLSEAFNGGWFNPARPNSGVLVDFIPQPNAETGRTGILFIAGFSYDSEGRDRWVILQTEVFGQEFAFQNVPVLAFSGGRFFGTQQPNQQQVGVADITIHSCDAIEINFRNMAAAYGNIATGRMVRLTGPADPEICPYKREFSAESCGNFPGQVTADPARRTCTLNAPPTNPLRGDILFRNEATWVLTGLTVVGGDNTNTGTLRIEPGTVITGGGETSDYLYIRPGSKILAEGTRRHPIIMTSDRDGVRGQRATPGEWGGLVISGNAPANPCPSPPFNCTDEFGSLRYGGDRPNESSGVVRYVQIRYAGYQFAPNREVNSLTLQGAGKGTVIEYVQAFRGSDDAFEWFGGGANARYVIATECEDDNIDTDFGANPNVQFAIIKQGPLADHGIEADNNESNNDAAPRSRPTIANVTFLGSAAGQDGARLRRGTGFRIYNTVFTGFSRSCLNIEGAATFAAAGFPAPGQLTGTLVIEHSLVHCPTAARGNFSDDSGQPWLESAWFQAQPGNLTGDPRFAADGVTPRSDSPLRGGGRNVATVDPWFVPTDYIGAVRDENDTWWKGWTYFPLGN
jgi:hypothetical protein